MDDSLRQEYTPVKDELYQLLVAAYCYSRKYAHLGERLRSESRAFLLEETTALRLMSNEIILQLCKLDDDKAKWTLRSLKKEFCKRIKDGALIERANALAKKYRDGLRDFKQNHRNEYIAHRNAEDYPDPFHLPDLQSAFKALVSSALELFELLWGAKVPFRFQLGSHEPVIDLKAELGLG